MTNPTIQQITHMLEAILAPESGDVDAASDWLSEEVCVMLASFYELMSEKVKPEYMPAAMFAAGFEIGKKWSTAQEMGSLLD